MSEPPQYLTVDELEYHRWCEGELMHFVSGKGHCVNELHCEAVDAALERGEPVLTTRGQKLTGRYLKYEGEELQLHEGTPQS